MEWTSKLTLVELSICSDPLCGEEVFALLEVSDGKRFLYIVRSPMGEESQVAESNQKLSDDEVYRLLDEGNWFDSDIALQSAEIEGLEDILRPLEGEWPLFTLSSSLPLAEQKFREWIELWIGANRA
jgi:hypothetical protein